MTSLLVEAFLGVVFVAAFLGLLYLRNRLHTGEPGASKAFLSLAIVVSFFAIVVFSIYLSSAYL